MSAVWRYFNIGDDNKIKADFELTHLRKEADEFTRDDNTVCIIKICL